MIPSILRERQPKYLYLWWNFCNIVWFLIVFSFSWGNHFYLFFLLCRFSGAHFQYSKVFVGLLFSERSDLVLNSKSIPSVLSHFLLFIISTAHFSLANSIPISWQYIHIAYFGFFNSFVLLANSLISSVNISWWFFSFWFSFQLFSILTIIIIIIIIIIYSLEIFTSA